MLAGRGNYQGALELMAYEQELEPEPRRSSSRGLAAVYEQRADQVEQDRCRRRRRRRADPRAAAGPRPAHQGRRRVRRLLARADARRRQGLRRRAVEGRRPVRPRRRPAARDLGAGTVRRRAARRRLTPDALLRLGRAYQAAGQFDKAIAAFQRNQFRYPKSLAATKSGVPLAQAYIAKGPESYAKAEKVLLAWSRTTR